MINLNLTNQTPVLPENNLITKRNRYDENRDDKENSKLALCSEDKTLETSLTLKPLQKRVKNEPKKDLTEVNKTPSSISKKTMLEKNSALHFEPVAKKVKLKNNSPDKKRLEIKTEEIFNVTDVSIGDGYDGKEDRGNEKEVDWGNIDWGNEKEINSFLSKVSHCVSKSSIDPIPGYETLSRFLSFSPPHIRASSEAYIKVAKKNARIPVGLGIKNGLGIFAHLKKPCGKGHFKQAFFAQWIKPTGEIESVVYKKLNKEKPDRIKNTESELKLQSSFNHPSIVQLHSYDVYDNSHKIAIYEEACDGDMKQHFTMKQENKLTVAIDITDAIIFLHERGYSHNDIKLNNIFLKNGHGKLADFGNCHAIGSFYCGYKRTRAPEQEPNQVSQQVIGNDKTDVYQFGLCLWHLFHPNPPHCHLDSNYIYPCSRDNQTGLLTMFQEWSCSEAQDEQMKNLVIGCLDLDPQKRPSMEAVKADLLKIQELQNRATSV